MYSTIIPRPEYRLERRDELAGRRPVPLRPLRERTPVHRVRLRSGVLPLHRRALRDAEHAPRFLRAERLGEGVNARAERIRQRRARRARVAGSGRGIATRRRAAHRRRRGARLGGARGGDERSKHLVAFGPTPRGRLVVARVSRVENRTAAPPGWSPPSRPNTRAARAPPGRLRLARRRRLRRLHRRESERARAAPSRGAGRPRGRAAHPPRRRVSARAPSSSPLLTRLPVRPGKNVAAARVDVADTELGAEGISRHGATAEGMPHSSAVAAHAADAVAYGARRRRNLPPPREGARARSSSRPSRSSRATDVSGRAAEPRPDRRLDRRTTRDRRTRDRPKSRA